MHLAKPLNLRRVIQGTIARSIRVHVWVYLMLNYWSVGGCRAQNKPKRGGLSTYKTFIIWLIFTTFLSYVARFYPGLALEYALTYSHLKAIY